MPRLPATPHPRFDMRWWIAGAAAFLLLVWIASCALCSRSEPIARAPRAPSESTGSSARTDDAEIVALRRALDREVEAREHLELEVASLRERLDSGAVTATPGAEGAAATADRGTQRSMFDGNSLVAAGIAPGDAQSLRTRWEG